MSQTPFLALKCFLDGKCISLDPGFYSTIYYCTLVPELLQISLDNRVMQLSQLG